MKNIKKNFKLLLVAPILLFSVSCNNDNDNNDNNNGDDGIITKDEIAKATLGNYDFAQYNYTNISLDPGNSGKNVVWDFSNLQTPNDTWQSNYYSCPGNSACGNFTNANRIVQFGNLNSFTYFNLNNDELKTIGSYSIEDGKDIFENPETIYKFPIQFNQSFEDSYETRLESTNSRTQGSVKNLVDGQGKLITPAGTYNDVLRIKTVRKVINPDVIGFEVNTIEYVWLDSKGVTLFVLSNNSVTYNNITTKNAFHIYTKKYTPTP